MPGAVHSLVITATLWEKASLVTSLHNFMDDSEPSWLRDEHRVILYAVVSLVVVVGGHRGWQEYHKYQEKALRRARILRMVENSKRNKDRVDNKTETSEPGPKVEDVPAVVNVVPDEPDGARKVEEGLEGNGIDATRPKRSKERRKRGRDVYKGLIRQEKKSMGVRSLDSSADSRQRASYSRSPSSARSIMDDPNAETPKATTSDRFSPNVDVRNGSSSSSLTPHDVVSSTDDLTSEVGENQDETIVSPKPRSVVAQDQSQPLGEITSSPQSSFSVLHHDILPSISASEESNGEASHSGTSSVESKSSSSSRDASLLRELSSLTAKPYEASGSLLASPPLVAPAPTIWLEDIAKRKPHATPSSRASTSSLTTSDGSWEFDNQSQSSSNFRRSPPPRFRSRSRASASPLPMSTLGSTEFSMFVNNNAAPSSNASLATQIASYKGALEAARQREDKYKQDVERYTKETEMLRWRWNEDAAAWKRRETELQKHIHLLTHQLHSLNIASPPHLQPFMAQASQPNLHAGFGLLHGMPLSSPMGAFPSPVSGQSPYTFSPLLHTNANARSGGIASSSASPSRDTHRDRSFEDDEGGINDELAEAILKRPDSIRPSSAASTSTSRSVSGRATRDVVTFPSLSELGNPQRMKKAEKTEPLREDDILSQDTADSSNGNVPDSLDRNYVPSTGGNG